MINPIDFGNINIVDVALKKADEAEKEKFEDILNEVTSKNQEKELKEACQNFEALFLNMMFKSMRNTVQKSDIIDNSYATGVYEDMMYEKYSEEAAKGGGIGLADMLYKQLIQNLEDVEE